MYGVSTKLIAVWHQGLLANCWVLTLSKWVWILTTLLKSFFGNLLIPFSLGMPRVSSYFLNKFSISSGMKVAASVVFGMTPSLIQSTCHLLRKTGHKAEFPCAIMTIFFFTHPVSYKGQTIQRIPQASGEMTYWVFCSLTLHKFTVGRENSFY